MGTESKSSCGFGPQAVNGYLVFVEVKRTRLRACERKGFRPRGPRHGDVNVMTQGKEGIPLAQQRLIPVGRQHEDDNVKATVQGTEASLWTSRA